MHTNRSFFVIQRRNSRDQMLAVLHLNVGIFAVHDDQLTFCPKSKTCIPVASAAFASYESRNNFCASVSR